MNKETIEQLQQTLEQEKERLEKELSGFATPDEKMKYNWNTKYPSKERGNKEEEADEAGEYENLLSLEENLELKLKNVLVALEKIEKGSYGTCEKCGKEVEEERLKVYPEARLCIKCNEKK